MTDAEITSDVRRIITQVAPDVDPEAIKPEEDIRRSLGIDSFDHLRILTAISEHFGIGIPDADQGKFRSLNEIVVQLRKLGVK